MSRSTLRSAAVTLLALVTLAACSDDSTPAGDEQDRGPSGSLELVSAEIPAEPPADVADGTTHVVTVNLTPGVEWSDGTPLTAQDFLGQYDILWAQQNGLWQSLTDVRATSDTQLVFEAKELSLNVMRQILRSNQTASSSQFGDIYTSLNELRTGGADPADPEVVAVLDELDAMAPAEPVTYGPFVIDPSSVTAQQMRMVKNEGGFNADQIAFDRVDVAWGQTQQTVPLILQDELDYTTDALTPSDVEAVKAKSNIELIRTPLGTGTGLWFNESIKPFDDKRFRQAVALVIDRERNAKVSLGDAAKPITHMAGFSDNYVDEWLSDEVVAELDTYERDEAAATQLLEEVGLVKDGDSWTYDGETLQFEITAPADFPDFLASGKDVSAQLNEFGFDTQVRGIPAANRPDTIKQGRYEAILDFSLVSAPEHPATSLDWNMAAGFFGTNDPESSGSKGLNWPWRQQAPDGTEVYIPDLLAAAVAGLDAEPQKGSVETLAQIFNDQLPVIPIFERYTTDPIAHGPRVTGWLPLDHPIYENNQANDPYVAMQFLAGVLQPVEGSDGSFRTSAAYAQPPNFSWNYYAGNSMYNTLTTPSYHATLPPLMWYSNAIDGWVPGVAESYSVAEVG